MIGPREEIVAHPRPRTDPWARQRKRVSFHLPSDERERDLILRRVHDIFSPSRVQKLKRRRRVQVKGNKAGHPETPFWPFGDTHGRVVLLLPPLFRKAFLQILFILSRHVLVRLVTASPVRAFVLFRPGSYGLRRQKAPAVVLERHKIASLFREKVEDEPGRLRSYDLDGAIEPHRGAVLCQVEETVKLHLEHLGQVERVAVSRQADDAVGGGESRDAGSCRAVTFACLPVLLPCRDLCLPLLLLMLLLFLRH